MTNLVKNGNFEASWSDEKNHAVLVCKPEQPPLPEIRDNIFTPPNWITWFYHDPGTWDQPEVRDAWESGDPRRVHSGQKGMLLFTFYRKHDAGFLQQVQVTPGTRVRLTAWAHAWSNWHDGAHPDNPRWSDGPGYDAGFALEGDVQGDNWRNFTFYVGIDPTGGTNPFADTVVWGQGAHIYNKYAQVPAAEATAQADVVTVFLRSKTLWTFKHNDAYWDDVSFVVMGDEPSPGGEWSYPAIEHGSKLGVHGIYANNIGAFTDQLVAAQAHFPAVKAVSDLGWLTGIKQSSPDTITIARMVSPVEGCQGVETADLDVMADGLIDVVLDKIETDSSLRNTVDFWEICNEPDPPSVNGYRRLSLLMIKCMERAETHSLKLGIFGLCSGTPEWDEMVAMVETGVFAKAKEGGHILTLHEGVFPFDAPIDKWWGDLIPGSPAIEGAGALCFRYRYLYSLLEARNEVIPLVISEFYGGHQGFTVDEVVERLAWYDTEFRQDYWAWAFCPFTLGPSDAWQGENYEFAYSSLVDYAISIKDEANALPPSSEEDECWGKPRVQYERTYVLLPPSAGAEWVHAVTDATWDERRYTTGGSADDAGIGALDCREVIAVNPGEWADGLGGFFRAYYPGIVYSPVEAETPEILRQKLEGEEPMPSGLLMWQCDPRWGGNKIKGWYCSKTLCQTGCWVSACAMAQRFLGVNPGATPATANEALGEHGFDGCDTKWSAMRTALGIEVVKRTTDNEEARAWLDTPGHVLFAEVMPPTYQHWLLVTWMDGDKIYMYDPLKNVEGWVQDHYPLGVEAWRLVRVVGQAPLVPTLRGVHDREGLDWLRSEGLAGVATLAIYVGDADCIDLALDGYPDDIIIVGNLRYSYAIDDPGGQGTMPPPGNRLTHFEAACAETMRRNPCVDYWIYLNEMNNPREHPDGYAITPDDYADSYNRVWAGKPAGASLGPGCIDPCNAGWGDWRIAWATVLHYLSGADVMAFHTYTHGPDLNRIRSTEQFADAPLQGVYYDLKMLESQQGIVPRKFADLPQFVTETNHLTRWDGSIGWEPDAAQWVLDAYKFFTERRIIGASIFRFSHTGWQMGDLPLILEALRGC